MAEKLILLSIILIGIVFLSGCINQPPPTTSTTTSPTTITLPSTTPTTTIPTTSTTVEQIEYISLETLNNNFASYENQTVRVSGTFYLIGGFLIYDSSDYLSNHHIADADYKLIDSQGFYLFVSATGRDMSGYNQKTVSLEGTIKHGYDCLMSCSSQYYFELSKVL